jgi:hypothetical protein
LATVLILGTFVFIMFRAERRYARNLAPPAGHGGLRRVT